MATIDLLDSPRRWLWCALGWGSLVEEDGDTGAVPEAREKRGGWQGESWRGRLCLTLLSDWCTRGLHLKDQVVFIQLEKHWGHPKKGEILKKNYCEMSMIIPKFFSLIHFHLLFTSTFIKQ